MKAKALAVAAALILLALDVFGQSGRYTPQVIVTDNVLQIQPRETRWLQVGDVVMVAGTASVVPAAAGGVTIYLSLPVPALLGSNSLSGTLATPQGYASTVNGYNWPATGIAILWYYVANTANETVSYTYSYSVAPPALPSPVTLLCAVDMLTGTTTCH